MQIIEPLTSYQKAIELFKTTGLNPYRDDFVELANPQQGKIIDTALKILKFQSLHETQQDVYRLEGKVNIAAIKDYIEILRFEQDSVHKLQYTFEYVCYQILIQKCWELIKQIQSEQ